MGTNLTPYSGDLSKEERSEYIRAVKCLLTKPSKLEAGKYPGAKSRYDDFVVVHMNMTPSVHGTVSLLANSIPQSFTETLQANFMHWHRYYIWAYETALKTECEFKGTQPVCFYTFTDNHMTDFSLVLELGQILGLDQVSDLQRRRLEHGR